MEDKLKLLRDKIAQAKLGGGEDRIKSQHGKGKLTARERLHFLMDEGSFEEIGMLVTHRSSDFGLDKQKFLGDGVVTGYGTINGRSVAVFAQDFTVFGGSLSETHAEKICKLMDFAMKNGIPVIGLNDSGGARIQEGVVSLGGYADIFYRNTIASGVIPQISAIMGPCAGGAVYSPAITDFTMMVENTSYMFVTGPNVVKDGDSRRSYQRRTWEVLQHIQPNQGLLILLPLMKLNVFNRIKELLSYIPQNCEETTPMMPYESTGDETTSALMNIVPENPNQPYDMKDVIAGLVDGGDFMEVHKDYAENIVVGFARIAGRSIGIVANQPAVLAGVLDINCSRKGARFIRFCDSFNIPICSPWLMYRGFYLVPIRNGMELLPMAPSYYMHLQKPQFQRSR